MADRCRKRRQGPDKKEKAHGGAKTKRTLEKTKINTAGGGYPSLGDQTKGAYAGTGFIKERKIMNRR